MAVCIYVLAILILIDSWAEKADRLWAAPLEDHNCCCLSYYWRQTTSYGVRTRPRLRPTRLRYSREPVVVSRALLACGKDRSWSEWTHWWCMSIAWVSRRICSSGPCSWSSCTCRERRWRLLGCVARAARLSAGRYLQFTHTNPNKKKFLFQNIT